MPPLSLSSSSSELHQEHLWRLTPTEKVPVWTSCLLFFPTKPNEATNKLLPICSVPPLPTCCQRKYVRLLMWKSPKRTGALHPCRFTSKWSISTTCFSAQASVMSDGASGISYTFRFEVLLSRPSPSSFLKLIHDIMCGACWCHFYCCFLYAGDFRVLRYTKFPLTSRKVQGDTRTRPKCHI